MTVVQPSGPGTEVECPSCGHKDAYAGDAAVEVIHCTECHARIAFGELAHNWTNVPDEDARFIRVRIEQVVGARSERFFELKIDRQRARAIAVDILSVCPEPESPQQILPLDALDPAQPEFWTDPRGLCAGNDPARSE